MNLPTPINSVSKTTSILHILPALNIGGVEVGVMRSMEALRAGHLYNVFSIKGAGYLPIERLSVLALLQMLCSRNNRPDVVITSLWPAHPIGALLSIFGVRWIPFFHAASREGLHRDIILRCAAHLSRVQLCDSEATAKYIGLEGRARTFICPYLFKRGISPNDRNEVRSYDFVFCGRISKEKRLDLILSFLQLWQTRETEQSSLLIVSANDVEVAELRREVAARNLQVDIANNIEPKDVSELLLQSTFYLNLSDYEGFSMTTVEAIQCGCLPVVRPVGEIPKYVNACSGIIVTEPTSHQFNNAQDECIKLKYNPTARFERVDSALATLDRYDDYVSAFTRAVANSLAG